MRLRLALVIGKITIFLCRVLGSGGTTLPGIVAQKIDPQIVSKLSRRIPRGSVIISGTNGKTTTAKMVANILSAAGLSYIHNLSGSNLIRGIAATLVSESDLAGRFKKPLGIFEVDEATIPEAIKKLKPRIILINNFFRDQLDRYGELDTVSGIVKRSLKSLPHNSKIILNANDPFVAFLNEGLPNPTLYFGITDTSLPSTPEHAADIKNCTRCGFSFSYQKIFFSHVGIFRCPHCHHHSPTPDIQARGVQLKKAQSSFLELILPGKEKINIHLKLPGIYNVYNALAAASVAVALNIEPSFIKKGLENFSAAFGRVEKIKLYGRTLVIMLIKNPTGANVVIKTLAQDPTSKNFIFALNDKLADGTDVSWIWDVDFEILKDKAINFIYASGIRAMDMALRLKYAGLPLNKIHVEQDYEALMRKVLALTKTGQRIYLLPTYTAMLDIRKSLQKLTRLPHFWESL